MNNTSNQPTRKNTQQTKTRSTLTLAAFTWYQFRVVQHRLRKSPLLGYLTPTPQTKQQQDQSQSGPILLLFQ